SVIFNGLRIFAFGGQQTAQKCGRKWVVAGDSVHMLKKSARILPIAQLHRGPNETGDASNRSNPGQDNAQSPDSASEFTHTPDQHYEETDRGHVRITIRPGVLADLNEAYYRHKCA